MKREWWRAGILVTTLLAVPALGQETAAPAPVGDPGFVRGDLAISMRSGVSLYTGDLGDATNPGGYLGLQGTLQLLRYVGLELSVESSANGFNDDPSSTLWRHSGAALARVGLVLADRWQPFVGAGIGVSYLDATGDRDIAGFSEDLLMEIPLTAGVEGQFGGLVLGARATYRLLGKGDFGQGETDVGDLLTAGVTLGARF